MRSVLTALLLFVLLHASPSYGWKALSHYISLPLIEGAGIYTSVYALSHAEQPLTKTASGVNLALLGTNATLGLVTVFSRGDTSDRLRRVHRLVAYGITAAALLLSVSASVDENLREDPVRFVSYGYAGLTAIPLILFAF
jgi:heme A synthase